MMDRKGFILFVDDELQFAEIMGAAIKSAGFTVRIANSSKAAIELVEKEEFNLVITDINMPDMDGIELIRHIRGVNPEQKIMILTGFPSYESQEEALKLGVVNYVVKPVKPDRLIELVVKSLEDAEDAMIGAVEFTSADLIQMYGLHKKTIILEIRNGKNKGRVYLDNGRVIHAETDTRTGIEAFYDIQTWRRGTFTTSPLDKEITPTINESVEALLLEGARLQDERSKDNREVKGDTHGEISSPDRRDESRSNQRNKTKRRQSMPSMVEEINAALKELADNTPGLTLVLLVDNEGLPVGRHSAMEIAEGSAEKAAVASLALLGLARRTADQLDLPGFQEVLVKADTGYVYSLSVGGTAGYALVARTTQNVTLGALFMTVRAARDRVNRAMGIL